VVAERLTAIGLAVDGVSDKSEGPRSCVIAAVRRCQPHPSRSGLRLVTVDRGQGQEQTIVCGASNVPDVGGLVVLAPLGARLPGMKMVPLEARCIGDVMSEGMLVSEAELGVADSSEGLLIPGPPGSLLPGTPLLEALPEFDDVIFELDITPNRPDALGHVGVARDLAAAMGLGFQLPKPDRQGLAEESNLEELITIDNQAPLRCPRYGARAVTHVEVRPSPDFMRIRLARLGVRPISNVVDITNWLMLLFGNPMHAFDLSRVRGRRIVIRQAAAGEPFSTLDGVARRLDGDDLVIADGEGPVALAGVMGGLDSEIVGDTSRVLLECAYFAPRGIRRTARRHGLHTESSHRFERGVDFATPDLVLSHAQVLLARLASARIVKGTMDVKGELPELPTMTLRSQRLDALLGCAVPFDEAARVLTALGFCATSPSGDPGSLRVVGASHRPDVSIEADLIEEVARIRGLDEIPTVLPAIVPQKPRTTVRLEREVVREAISLGLSETVLYSFTNPAALAAARAPSSSVVIENPLSEDRDVLRTSLLPGLLEAVGRARRHGEFELRLFGLGNVFFPSGTPVPAALHEIHPPKAEDVALPVELPRFMAVLGGSQRTYLTRAPEVDVFDAKAVAVELVERLTGRTATVRHCADPARLSQLHPRGAAEVLIDDLVVGVFGPLHPDLVDAFDLGSPVQVVELSLEVVLQIGKKSPRYRPIPKLPAIVRDVCFEVPEALGAGRITSAISQAAGELCESVEPFDLFRGKSLGDGVRALAFRVTYRDPRAISAPDKARTLTDEEVDGCQQKAVREVVEKLGVKVR
jgi:phenylalanyl-tRNA synthetase beta chain